jgi:hypothetical protein
MYNKFKLTLLNVKYLALYNNESAINRSLAGIRDFAIVSSKLHPFLCLWGNPVEWGSPVAGIKKATHLFIKQTNGFEYFCSITTFSLR